MKDTRLMNEAQLIKKAVDVLMRELGPTETLRFLAMKPARHKESVKRHHHWQATLDKNEFFAQIFSSR